MARAQMVSEIGYFILPSELQLIASRRRGTLIPSSSTTSVWRPQACAPKSKADLAFTMYLLSWLATDGTAAIVEFCRRNCSTRASSPILLSYFNTH